MVEIQTSTKGAELTSIKQNGKEVLHDAETFWKRHAPLLFPIVGRLKEDKTMINGEEFEMKQHGFARDMEFEQVGENSYVLASNEETKKKFPFDFELHVSYDVDGDAVKTNCKVVNKDTKTMPFGLGFHPAYKCNYSTGAYYLEFEKPEENIKINQLQEGCVVEEPIPTEKYIKDNKLMLNANTFSNDALILSNMNSNKITLRTNDRKILTFDYKGFPYLGVWSEKGAPFVCLEPWFNTADKVNSKGNFEEKENLLRLEPNEEFSCSFGVEYQPVRTMDIENDNQKTN